MLSYVLIVAFVIMLASLAGVLFSWKLLGDWLTPRLRFLVAAAAGVFVVIIYGLTREAFHEGVSFEVVGAFIIGGILLEVVVHFLPKGAHHHHHDPHPEHRHTPIDARRIMLGDAVHNIHDGLTLVPAFLVSPVVGFGTAVGILLHEIVQEISEFFILREAGWPAKKALLWNLLVSGTILIGVALAMLLVSVEEIGHLLVAFSAGGFTYILFRDLLPSIIGHAKNEKRIPAYALSFLIGLVVMLAVSLALPHTHHDDEDEYPLPDGFGLASAAVPTNDRV